MKYFCISVMLPLIIVGLSVVSTHPQSAESTNKATLKGYVHSVFDTTQILPGANVLLFKGDSLVTGTAADVNGFYTLPGITHGRYELKAQFIGYGTSEYKLSITDADTIYLNIVAGKILPKQKLPFNDEDARRDIAEGKVELLTYGLLIGYGKRIEKKLRKLKKKYGFQTRNLGCVVNAELIQAIELYNREVKNHLEKRNGPNWFTKYLREQSEIVGQK